tara:strand:+ start:2711 stop:3547 length:837 start_codon:yes stop_codon:yes gene_type:complete
MLKTLSFIIFKILIALDYVFNFFTNRHFRYYLYQYLRDSSYANINFSNIKFKLFTPSHIAKWRSDTFFEKEPETISWIDNFNTERIIFWDIGANVGLYSLYSAKKFRNIEVFAFEPSTQNLNILSRNIYINNLQKKISICPFAVSNDENLFLEFKESSLIEGSALSAFGVNYDQENKPFLSKSSYTTFGTNINFLINNKILEIPDYIKIDVDGIEHLILDGANKYLSNKKIKSILIETNEEFILQNESIKNLLLDAGFELHKKFRQSENMYNLIFNKK